MILQPKAAGTWITDKGRRFLDLIRDMDEDALDALDEVGYSCSDCPEASELPLTSG